MKLDKIKFARLIAHCCDNGLSTGDWEIGRIDEIVDIEAPVVHAKAACADVDELLKQINAPDGFIPAIKAYRVLTGAELKESKEAIERYRNVPKYREKPNSHANDQDAGY